METWKDVVGYEGLYKVSSLGKVMTLFPSNRTKPGAIRRPQIVGAGYHIINLTKDGICSYEYIHRIVAGAFIPNPENKKTINHKNGIKTDNRVENLERATQKENVRHSHRTGLKKRKITPDHAMEIRTLRQSGLSLKELSKMFGVTVGYISSICSNKKAMFL